MVLRKGKITVIAPSGLPTQERKSPNGEPSKKAEGLSKLRQLRKTQVELSLTGESAYCLKPYWGKPAVRNFRGGAGNVANKQAHLLSILPASWTKLIYLFADHHLKIWPWKILSLSLTC